MQAICMIEMRYQMDVIPMKFDMLIATSPSSKRKLITSSSLIHMPVHLHQPQARRKTRKEKNHLIIPSTPTSHSSHRKLKAHTPPRQLPVHLRVDIQSMIHPSAFLLIQHNFRNFAPVLSCTNPLTHNLDWIYDILQDSFMNSGKSSAGRSFLGLRVAGAGATFRTR